MADASSAASSSVVPGDSASSLGKKNKPGKRERQAAREARQSSGVPASSHKAQMFAAGARSDPVPQPGKFPVVFQTGAGEPSRDREFKYSGPSMFVNARRVYDKYMMNDKFAEFKANSDFSSADFQRFVQVAFFLGLAQQTVHAHVGMGLPQGDFAPVASSEVVNFAAVRAVITQYGEYSVPSMGSRFLLADYPSEVKMLTRLAWETMGKRGREAGPRSWLPTSSSDRSFKLEIAQRLSAFLKHADLSITSSVLEDAVLSGFVPDAWETIKSALGNAPGEGEVDLRDRFDFLFKSYPTEGQFTTAFSSEDATGPLAELGLVWEEPSAGHLQWDLNVKTVFSNLAAQWARVVPTFEKFFSMSSGLSNRYQAVGSTAQMASVSVTDSITVVKATLAVSAPEFSLLACFPCTAVYSGGTRQLVVLTTPLNVDQRATEFCQLDWK